MKFERVLRPPLPASFGPSTVLIYDRRLARVVRGFSAWAKSFPECWGVEGGEKLKDARGFPKAARRLSEIAGDWSPREMTIVAAGGGSVGDFAGFLASVYKRGVGLVHMPTTWLSALDSAHGGKTALNLGGFKNQIGTFYPASRTIACKAFLCGQPEERAREALGELAKIALIDGGRWVEDLRVAGPGREGEAIWKALPGAVRAKMKVVRRDPFERKGERQILNLGHTLGHALESERSLAHGTAVTQGLFFAVEWSAQRGLLSMRERMSVDSFLREDLGLRDERAELASAAQLRAALAQDKKRAGRGTGFIFLRGWGRPARVMVSLDEIVAEARRQGRLR